jgi:hypothetical protein
VVEFWEFYALNRRFVQTILPSIQNSPIAARIMLKWWGPTGLEEGSIFPSGIRGWLFADVYIAVYAWSKVQGFWWIADPAKGAFAFVCVRAFTWYAALVTFLRLSFRTQRPPAEEASLTAAKKVLFFQFLGQLSFGVGYYYVIFFIVPAFLCDIFIYLAWIGGALLVLNGALQAVKQAKTIVTVEPHVHAQ